MGRGTAVVQPRALVQRLGVADMRTSVRSDAGRPSSGSRWVKSLMGRRMQFSERG